LVAGRRDWTIPVPHRNVDSQGILDVLPVAVYVCDADGLITYFNRQAVQLWGREPKLNDPANRYCGSFRIYSPEGVAVTHETCWMARSLRDGKEYVDRKAVIEQPNGQRRLATVHVYPIRNGEGQLSGAITIVADVTDQQEAEDAKRESEQRFTSFMRHLPAAAWIKDTQGRYLYANDYAQDIFGIPLDELRGKTDQEVFPPDTALAFQKNDRQAKDLRDVVRNVETLEHAGDGVHESIVTKFPIFDEDDSVAAIGGVAIDVTEQRRATAALRESEARFRLLAELLPVGLYTCEARGGTITYYNKTAARIWGREPSSGADGSRFCGSFRLFRTNGEFLPHDECPMAVAMRDGSEFRNEEVIVEQPGGARCTILLNIDPIRDAAGRIVGAVNVFLDVTKLREAQRRIAKEKNNLRTLLKTLPVAVLIAHDPQCRRISGNPAAEELLRMGKGDNFSKSAPAGEQPNHFRLTKNGRVLAPEELPVQRAANGEMIRNDELDFEFDDGTLVHALMSASPLRGPTGAPRGAVAAALDVTDSKNAEASLKDAARRTEEFLATLGHELRNPLAPIRLGLELIKLAGNDSATVQRTREMMERQTDQLIALVDDLLDISRISRGRVELEKGPVKLTNVIQHAVETVRPWIEEAGHELAVDAPDEGTCIDGDQNRLAQMLSNLLNNACKYTPSPGRIQLTARRREGYAVLSVEDNGVGIPSETAGQVFEIFRQLDPPPGVPRSGLGIGLTLVKQLAEMHGGTVHVHSDGIGRGSRFTVRLPVLSEAFLGKDDHRGPVLKRSSSKRRVIVADDNKAAADGLSLVMDQLGHEVRTAYDGSQAVEIAAEFRPDLVLMDLSMPGMDGYEAARRIRQQPWGKAILLVAVSGWGQEQHKSLAAEAGFDHHLVKPIAPADMQRMLSKSLSVLASD
jgi:PAS domain S-box-containing protein